MAVDKRSLWDMYTKSGKQFMRLRNWPEAERMFAAALQVAEEFGPRDPRLGVALNNAAHVNQARRRYAKAEALYRRALDIALKAHGQDHPDTAVNLANLAGLYHAQDLQSQAEALYRQAIDTLARTLGDGHPSLARLLEGYGALLAKMGRHEEAAGVQGRARSIRDRKADPETPA